MIGGEKLPKKEIVATIVTEDSDWSFCAESCHSQFNNKLEVSFNFIKDLIVNCVSLCFLYIFIGSVINNFAQGTLPSLFF